LCGAVPRGGLVNFAVFFSRTRGSAQCNGEHDAERPYRVHTVVDHSVDLGADVQFDGASEIIVNGNPDELERAFSNLVDNAVKFAGGAELSVTRQGDTAIVEVADHGPGIPAETRDAMLEPFRRGSENSTLASKDGFGLGLAIARAVFTAHHGRLELGEREGGGLSVRVELPLA